MEKNANQQATTLYPPIVSVLGHVDHGKTTLLDTIRKTNHAARETGGITQNIGASQIEVTHEGKKRMITFIDTPGHEAFANMRSQGVNASDIVLLIVAADDGIKPQTRESIQKIKESKVPYVVVITKADLPTANPERVKQQLLSEGVLLEGLGGEVPYIAVSAKTGQNIHELLDLILLIFDVTGVQKNEQGDFLGVVIDSKLDKRRGVVATIVVKSGVLTVSDKVYIAGKEVGKVRALFEPNAKGVKTAAPGEACEILGLAEVLPMGTLLYTHPVTDLPQVVSESLAMRQPVSLAAFFAVEAQDVVPVILRTETSGELEAIKESLPEKVKIIFEGQGEISVSDILMAKDFHAIVLGFNVNIERDAKILADNEHVFYKTYKIIYEMLDELIELIESLGKEEAPLGRAEIIASFEGKEGTILGMRVLEGRLALNDKVKLMRKEQELGKTKISSLKRGKQDVKEVAKNLECGLMLTPALDFALGDMLLSYKS